MTSTLRMPRGCPRHQLCRPQAPALQAQSPTSTKEGRWKEEDEGEPSGQAKETAAAAGAAVRARLSPSRQIAFCSLLFDCFPQCAILGPGAAFQLQQETIKKFVLFLVQEKCW